MTKISIPKGLPKSKIIQELSIKVESRTDLQINSLGILEDFRKRVIEEVRHINELFPEYTPHDDTYHLSRLFSIADLVLGEVLIESLNSTELLILSLSLYGHDWGMAVSEVEKDLIVEDKIREGFEKNDFALLTEEHSKFQNFLKENNYSDRDSFPLSIWQEYVRNSHAMRSGERIKKYFEKINPGLGEAAARVCEAHWLDFKYLEDNIIYPTNFAVLSESVNLKAISVYLRLIDLLDISEDRTPYIIWKFVAPKNLRSKMEWEKHRSIHSISSSSYQGGRVIQIEGSTKSNDVYASLMDLKAFCEDQLKGCNDLLSQININRYNLDLFNINWRIRAIGFKPITIQFEFDRQRMFEILSDEIYQGDKYVFLRELLQNSIDAIKFRKEVLERKGGMKTSMSEFGLIEINVTQLGNGDAEIIVCDNGIGMNEYILKNYLSVAGKSYYTSDDFKNLGLRMDPISKFGVGVLSCFMVADRIDIETYREPYLSSVSEKLKIQIPSATHQFRVQACNDVDNIPGTKFKVYVSREKLADNSHGTGIEKLEVTKYISKIAGFVEIPIKISENAINTLLIGPFEDESKFSKKFSGYSIKRNELSFPWAKVFQPQSLEAAKRLFKEKSIDIQNDLKFDGASGKIIVLEPVDDKAIITSDSHVWPNAEFIINNEKIKVNDEWIEYGRRIVEDGNDARFGKSATTQPQYQVYLDGILVANMSSPDTFENFDEDINDDKSYRSNLFEGFFLNYRHDNLFCLPYIIVNFSKKAFNQIDISRTESVGKNNKWELKLWKMYRSYLKKIYEPRLLASKPKERAFLLAHLIIFKRISLLNVQDLLPVEDFVVPVIGNNGSFKFKEWRSFSNKSIYLQPENFHHFDNRIKQVIENKKRIKGKLDNWKGGDFICAGVSQRSELEDSSQTRLISKMVQEVIHKTHSLKSIRFLNSPWKNSPPLIQKVCVPNVLSSVNSDNEIAVLNKGVSDVDNISMLELTVFNHIFWQKRIKNFRLRIPTFCLFEKPFENQFSFAFDYLNFKHHNTKFLIQVFCNLELHIRDKETNKVISGQILDVLQELPLFNYGLRRCTLSSLNASFQRIYEFSQILNWNIRYVPYVIDKSSFVDKSIIQNGGQVSQNSPFHWNKLIPNLSNYSRILK
ncbi:HD domain-containing protein [Terrimonas alba]|uniref:HD domain-containing protein n=1 Tax=Terrimonas alba TaxID=3349636 RepID=UPI0035F227BD